jgi:hypothetical protein
LYYFECMHDVIYEAESALCNINKHHLQLNVAVIGIYFMLSIKNDIVCAFQNTPQPIVEYPYKCISDNTCPHNRNPKSDFDESGAVCSALSLCPSCWHCWLVLIERESRGVYSELYKGWSQSRIYIGPRTRNLLRLTNCTKNLFH